MQQTAANPPSPVPPSFAGFLAALTTPVPKTAWNTDDLADDVTTLSYEHALRAHSRYKPADTGEWGFAEVADFAANQLKEARQVREDKSGMASSSLAATMPVDTDWRDEAVPTRGVSTSLNQTPKRASITIRLSKAECDQLHRRAAQAGLTVSAYLRSCTFEAETLRAQVRDVLAELRTATSPAKPSAPVTVRRPWFEWLFRLLPRWREGQRVARA